MLDNLSIFPTFTAFDKFDIIMAETAYFVNALMFYDKFKMCDRYISAICTADFAVKIEFKCKETSTVIRLTGQVTKVTRCYIQGPFNFNRLN